MTKNLFHSLPKFIQSPLVGLGLMATQEDVIRIASLLPGARLGAGSQFSVEVEFNGKRRGFVWEWMERTDPKKARVPNPEVLAVAVPNLEVKEMLLQSDSEKYFTEPHYNGYPAVLVRLSEVGLDELEEVITEAWRCRAPKELVAMFEP